MNDLRLHAVPVLADNYVWLLADASGAAVAVDPGEAAPVLEALARERLRLKAILLTHHHPDHIAGAASLTFLFCATAFGTVLVLGGLRFGTVETEIWIQTTQFLDLRAAAVLSVVQLVVVVGTLLVAARTRARN